MTETTNYQLSQWEAEDRVLHTDFNADNARLDAALGSLSATTAGKLGRMEIINLQKTDGDTTQITGLMARDIKWDEWEYICFFVHYPGTEAKDIPLFFDLYAPQKYTRISPMMTPGFLAVLLPGHDGSKPAAGFVLSHRFVPFSLAFPFNSITQLDCVASSKIIIPNMVLFGGK